MFYEIDTEQGLICEGTKHTLVTWSSKQVVYMEGYVL